MCCSKQYVSFILVGLYIDSCLFMFCTHEVIAEYSHIEKFPTDYSDEVQGWIKRIRFSYKRQEKLMIKTSGPALTPKRLEELKALNFTWDPHERGFEGFFELLVAYKKLHGNCHIPEDFSDNPTFELGKYVKNLEKALEYFQMEMTRKLVYKIF